MNRCKRSNIVLSQKLGQSETEIMSQKAVTDSIKGFQDSINSVQGNLDKEIRDRKTADSTLNTQILQETQERKDKDKEISDKLEQEIKDRKAGDSNIETQINNVDKKFADYPKLEKGLIPSSYLPSYVDDVIEGTLSTFPKPGESDKIYVDTNTNIIYRWSGSGYIEISKSIGLGKTASTAYPGNEGLNLENKLSSLTTEVSNLNTKVDSYPWKPGEGENSAVMETCTASERYSVAEGWKSEAQGIMSHAEGNKSIAKGDSSHAEGASFAEGAFSHAECQGHAIGTNSHAEGGSTVASGANSHTEGLFTKTTHDSEHASGRSNISNGEDEEWGSPNNTLFSVGNGEPKQDGVCHNAFEIRQDGTIYIPDMSSSLPYYQKPMINLQQALKNTGSGGDTTVVACPWKEGEGEGSVQMGTSEAVGRCSVAEGALSIAEGRYSHAENSSSAKGDYSHAEGQSSQAVGEGSHAEGNKATASGRYSHAEGMYTQTTHTAEHASGIANISNGGDDEEYGSSKNTLFSIGNGEFRLEGVRHNAFEVRQDGSIFIADTTQEGEHYNKPMMNLQQTLKNLENKVEYEDSEYTLKFEDFSGRGSNIYGFPLVLKNSRNKYILSDYTNAIQFQSEKQTCDIDTNNVIKYSQSSTVSLTQTSTAEIIPGYTSNLILVNTSSDQITIKLAGYKFSLLGPTSFDIPANGTKKVQIIASDVKNEFIIVG